MCEFSGREFALRRRAASRRGHPRNIRGGPRQSWGMARGAVKTSAASPWLPDEGGRGTDAGTVTRRDWRARRARNEDPDLCCGSLVHSCCGSPRTPGRRRHVPTAAAITRADDPGAAAGYNEPWRASGRSRRSHASANAHEHRAGRSTRWPSSQTHSVWARSTAIGRSVRGMWRDILGAG